ncbi:MAG: hypothetical protein IPJ93_13575 [Bacteroidota bacterium]|nr:MAG: hypothetical protein IPJ93_13575 [Bacteroidota bacterium]
MKFEEIKRNNSVLVFISKMSGLSSKRILNNKAKSPTDKLVLMGGALGSVSLEKSILRLASIDLDLISKNRFNLLGMDCK